jgi:hypothetical protein
VRVVQPGNGSTLPLDMSQNYPSKQNKYLSNSANEYYGFYPTEENDNLKIV